MENTEAYPCTKCRYLIGTESTGIDTGNGTCVRCAPTYQKEQEIRDRARTTTSMSDRQLAEAYRICAEFGPGFDGIKDRADMVKCCLDYPAFYSDEWVARAVQGLLTSVNPRLTARIMGW